MTNQTDGWDTFKRDCGTEEMLCRVCQSPMTVRRGVEDFRNSRDAMNGLKTKFDYFQCQYSPSAWHTQALKILQEAEETASPTLKKILKTDANDIVFRKGQE